MTDVRCLASWLCCAVLLCASVDISVAPAGQLLASSARLSYLSSVFSVYEARLVSSSLEAAAPRAAQQQQQQT